MDFARCVLFISAASQLVFAQGKAPIAVIRRGQSSCTHKESACREETVVYRFVCKYAQGVWRLDGWGKERLCRIANEGLYQTKKDEYIGE